MTTSLPPPERHCWICGNHTYVAVPSDQPPICATCWKQDFSGGANAGGEPCCGVCRLPFTVSPVYHRRVGRCENAPLCHMCVAVWQRQVLAPEGGPAARREPRML